MRCFLTRSNSFGWNVKRSQNSSNVFFLHLVSVGLCYKIRTHPNFFIWPNKRFCLRTNTIRSTIKEECKPGWPPYKDQRIYQQISYHINREISIERERDRKREREEKEEEEEEEDLYFANIGGFLSIQWYKTVNEFSWKEGLFLLIIYLFIYLQIHLFAWFCFRNQ